MTQKWSALIKMVYLQHCRLVRNIKKNNYLLSHTNDCMCIIKTNMQNMNDLKCQLTLRSQKVYNCH